MKVSAVVGLTILTGAFAGQALSLDCGRASTRTERSICADPALRRADAAMGAAYARLLHDAAEPQTRAALIASQRRWIAARERDLGALGREDGIEAAQRVGILLAATEARTAYLREGVGGRPRFIADADRQRGAVAAYTGSPLAGYDGACSFIPDRGGEGHYTYACFGTLRLQHGDRLCLLDEGFATYTSVGSRAVATVENSHPRVVATCAINSGRDSACPDMEGAGPGARWNLRPTREQAGLGEAVVASAKLDPELPLPAEEDRAWLRACLTDPSFPLSDPAANRAGGR